MSNYQQLKMIRKYKRNRRRVERIGVALFGIGFFMAVGVSGEYCELPFRTIMLIAFSGTGVMGIGTFLINLVDRFNKEHPLVYKPVEKGDDLWYTMYHNEIKRQEKRRAVR